MNKSTLKSYAVKARKEFIKAVRERAHFLGIMADHIEKATSKGDTVFIAGRPHRPEDLKGRDELVNTINKLGFDQVIQSVAYTWFNRFAALRYMEIHGYLDHGLRVLSNPSGENSPEIMERAADVDLLYLDKTEVIDLKLAGNKDAQLYRQLILSQCWTLAEAMPFLFTKKNLEEYVDLLLPDNLLLSDSIVRSMVADIDEDDWQEVEIIGWLYQFFISERKDEVIGKVVKSEDIPAATQLFTPNWIVKYMTQNSLGRLWLETYPESPLKKEMEYYIEPAEQTPEVQAQLEKVRPKELNPEELKVLDPACGSGHILTEAFDLLFQIYNERGYRKRDIPQLILEKNLYGLDIDQRAAQMAGFALIMKAREHDRRIFERGINLNVLEITESNAIDIDELHLGDLQRFDVKELLDTFHDAKTFGSLITVEPYLLDKLSEVKSKLEKLDQSANLHEKKTAESLLHFYHLAAILADKYDAVIANPPFMGSKYLNPSLKKMMKKNFKGFEKDLFASFIVKSTDHTKTNGYLGFMSPFTWMFISSFEKLREEFLTRRTLLSLIRPEHSRFFRLSFCPNLHLHSKELFF